MQDECSAGCRYERRRPSKVLKIAESFTNLDESAKSRFVRGPHSKVGRRFRDGERTKRVCCDDDCDRESGVSEDCERVGDRRVTGSSCTALRTAVAALYPFDDFVLEKIGSGFFSEVFKVCFLTALRNLPYVNPRVQGWFLFDTPIATLVMVIAYLACVLVAGPIFMANRKPYQLQHTLVAYNAAQVLLSSYMFYEHLMSGWWDDYSLTCQPVDYSTSEKAQRMLHLCWVYYFSKLSEFADTIFFVLRKKRSQITWLHLYHHSLTPFEAWLLVKFIAGGHGTFSNIVNNFVHVCMYAYYMLAAMGPKYHKYLWWKKHLTHLQLAQFFFVLFHSISALVYDCGYPKIIASGLILHSSIFIVLFTNFYIQAYKEKPKRKETNNNDEKTLNGHCKPENGLAITENGNMKTENGNIKIGNGHTKTENGYCKTENGHAGNGFVQNGHLTNGHTKSENGYVNSENGCLKNGFTNGHTPPDSEKLKTQ